MLTRIERQALVSLLEIVLNHPKYDSAIFACGDYDCPDPHKTLAEAKEKLKKLPINFLKNCMEDACIG